MITQQNIAGLEVYACHPAKDAGKPPLLCVHGAFAGGWMWTETFLPALAAAGHPCYALSLRGHGGSHGHEHIHWHSISDYVDDVRTVIEGLGIDPVLIGHSMGGFVVQKYLERYPVPAAALLCSVPPQGLIAAQFHLMFQKPELFLEINRIMSGQGTDTRTLREALFAGEADEAMLTQWLTQMQTESQRALWDMSMFNLPNVYRMHRPPLLIVGAEKDMLVPAFLVQSCAQTYGEHAHIFRNMGHAITHEAGWQDVVALITDWLAAQLPAA